jgi:tryptophanyl-tRNA synthetase
MSAITSAIAQHKPRVFSGIQPSGVLHIGNYLGAIRQWLESQEAKESFFCIVDLHAITMPQDPETLRYKTLDVAAMYLAAGIDPRFSAIFVQSHVSAHAECAWILNCVTPVGWLERMTQYKVKASQQASVSAGLLDYPVLQAADILLYDADKVPVGEDQKQHVELSQDIAQRFNYIYGDTFTVPQAVIPASGARIRALNDPTRKMSKSEAHVRGHAVRLVDDPDEIRYVIQRAVTDSGREILFTDDPGKAGVNNLLEIYELLTRQGRPEIEAHFAGKGYGVLKREVADVVVEFLKPIRQRYQELTDDRPALEGILASGAERAHAVADPKLALVKHKVGFVPPFKK